MIKKKSDVKKESSMLNNESTSEVSMNESLFKPLRNNMFKYRNALQSSDDEQCSSNTNDVSFYKIYLMILIFKVNVLFFHLDFE